MNNPEGAEVKHEQLCPTCLEVTTWVSNSGECHDCALKGEGRESDLDT